MRIAAIVLNFILIGIVAVMFATKGAPKGDDWMLVIPMIAAPVCSIIALLVSTDDGWMSLYFKRKALEEKKKIEAINDRTQS